MNPRIITEVNLVAHLRAKGFPETTRPQLTKNKKVVAFSFEDSPKLKEEIGAYFNHEALVDPLALGEALRLLKALIGELRTNERIGGDRDGN